MMQVGWELIVVLVVVGVAAVWATRAAWRSVRSGSVCSDCGDSGECPLAGKPELLEELQQRQLTGELKPYNPGRKSCSELLEKHGRDEPTDPAR